MSKTTGAFYKKKYTKKKIKTKQKLPKVYKAINFF